MTTFPKPKNRRKPGIVHRGDREICRTPAQWQKRREELYARAGGRCEGTLMRPLRDGHTNAQGPVSVRCGKMPPLHTNINPDTGDEVEPAGEAHHIIKRKMGGGSRDDSLANLLWLCKWCHYRIELPAKVVPSKH